MTRCGRVPHAPDMGRWVIEASKWTTGPWFVSSQKAILLVVVARLISRSLPSEERERSEREQDGISSPRSSTISDLSNGGSGHFGEGREHLFASSTP